MPSLGSFEAWQKQRGGGRRAVDKQLLGMRETLGPIATIYSNQGSTQLTNMAATSLTMLACGVCWEGGTPPAN